MPFQGSERHTETLSESTDILFREKLVTENTKALLESLKIVKPVTDTLEEREKPTRDFYPIWRTFDDLPPIASTLYHTAAELAAIPTHTLLRAATQIERRLEIWCMSRERGRRQKGKAKATSQEWATDY
jgi:RNA polymerase I-specific transcription initiation factor RRN7